MTTSDKDIVPEDSSSSTPASERTLGGARVGVLEGRMGRELGELVRRHGGVPVAAPAVRELPLAATRAVSDLIDGLSRGEVEVVVLLTGVGVDALFAEADRWGRQEELLQRLARATTVCRGPKPRAALRRRDVPVSVVVPEPYTTAEVVSTLAGMDVSGRGVAVVHYGERSTQISEALRERGARCVDICVYQWALPEDTTPIERMIDGVVAGELEAVVFTSQVQVRHLFAVAERAGRTADLQAALNTRAVVAAVGPTCAEALREVGVPPKVVPGNPKMGPMVVALADFLSRGRSDAEMRRT